MADLLNHSHSSDTLYDLVVVGGGIAGLAIAEIFARSGSRVLLIEKNRRLCEEASGEHHEWFHFGSLYSIFPSNQHLRTMVGGIDDLLEYYRDFDGMNLRVANDGRLLAEARHNSWFRDEQIQYVVSAINDPDFDIRNAKSAKDFFRRLAMKMSWNLVVKQFVSRHNRFYRFDWRRGFASQYIPKAGILDYSNKHISKFCEEGVNLDPDTHFKMMGYDRPMTAENIIRDLTCSFLGHGGVVSLETRFVRYGEKGEEKEIICEGKQPLRARHVIFAAGKGLKGLLASPQRFNVVASPLLVAYPRVCDVSFARLTPFMPETINHLSHSFDGAPYSLIGGGYFADPNNPEELEQVKETLVRRAMAVFPRLRDAKFVDVYYGYKTEMSTGLRERSYQYRISPIGDNVYVVLPGKFSLAFSLAVNVFRQIMGRSPSQRVVKWTDADVSGLIGMMVHKRKIRDLLAKDVVVR